MARKARAGKWVRGGGEAGGKGDAQRGEAGDLLVIIGPAALPQAARVGLVGATRRWVAAYLQEFRP